MEDHLEFRNVFLAQAGNDREKAADDRERLLKYHHQTRAKRLSHH
jgi:hypothetical protein